MLFHSFAFVFGFLPIAVLGFWVINRFLGWSAALAWLIAVSLFFYAQWGFVFLALLVGSILFNYTVGRCLLILRARPVLARFLLLGGIAANLAFLGYFKYANFFIDNLNLVLDASYHPIHLLLPVGISFYTFIQIGYLIEVYNGQVGEHRFAHYALFSGFFPYITAGPLVLQKEMLSQFTRPREGGLTLDHIAVGVTVFALGLFKKVVLADGIGVYADVMFDGAAAGALPTFGAAWLGALAYTLQLYFDFSGYTDMALGIGFLFGFRLPLNFNSPLKACSIIDFWRRWHMTMTRFFTTYVYSPIAVALMRRSLRHGDGTLARFLIAVAFPIVVTFVLAGLWHGAGWSFVVFGLIHGLALAANHAWRTARLPSLSVPLGWLLTMGVVVVGLVFFRAESVTDALAVLGAMAAMGASQSTLVLDSTAALAWIGVLGTIVLAFPNTMEIVRWQDVSSDAIAVDTSSWTARFAWQPSLSWAAASAFVLMLALGSISRETAFLYYRF